MIKNLFLAAIYGMLMAAVPISAKDMDRSVAESDAELSVFLFPISFYQKIISPVAGNRCRMQPSCSEYSKEAFQNHGFFIGWFMTCDRLMRCGRDEIDRSPPVWTPQGHLIADPLSANDAWLKKADEIIAPEN